MAKNCICGGGFTYSFPDACDCYKCCADVGLPIIAGTKTISDFDVDLSDIAVKGENREFIVNGDAGAGFRLEIKNSSGQYYNFTTQAFQTTATRLSDKTNGGSHKVMVLFPGSTSDEQYDIYLWAEVGAEHAEYNEVRFADGSIDINSSTGSNSLLLQKVIYQYPDVALTLSTYSPLGTIEVGSLVTDEIKVSRGKASRKTPFEISCSVTTAAKSYRIIKQPTQNDVIATLTPTIGALPIDLPGENTYPTRRAAFVGDDVNGAVTSGAVVRVDNTDLSAVIAVGDKITATEATDTVNGDFSGGATAITMDSAVATKMAVGDQVTGHRSLDGGIFTVASIDSTNVFSLNASAAIEDGATLTFSSKVNRSLTTVTVVETSGTATDFTMSQDVQFRDNQPLTFWPRMNYSWPINNYANIIKPGMTVISDGNLIGEGVVVTEYKDSIIEFEGTKDEKEIIKSKVPALSTIGKKPTVVKGLVTVQAGDIIFNTQLPLGIADANMKIAAYGESAILDLCGYRVRFSDLAIALTPITTTTTSAVSSSTSVPVTSRNGILDSISVVSGIGIDPSVENPTVSSGAGAVSGAGTIVLSAAQTLEDGITLTFTGAGQTATITGNIEVLEAGTADQALRFDVERLLSIT